MRRIGWLFLGLFIGLGMNPPFFVIAGDADQRVQPGKGDVELKMDRPSQSLELQQLRRQLTEISEKIDQQLKRQGQTIEEMDSLRREIDSLRSKRC